MFKHHVQESINTVYTNVHGHIEHRVTIFNKNLETNSLEDAI